MQGRTAGGIQQLDNRWTPDVPMLIPEINHAYLSNHPGAKAGWDKRGLHRQKAKLLNSVLCADDYPCSNSFDLSGCQSYQAISGAGRPWPTSRDE